MRLPLLGFAVDERFLTHRLRSTSTAGIVGVFVAMGLFAWHLYADHFWSWDLLAVGITMVTVKMGLMVWYRLTD